MAKSEIMGVTEARVMAGNARLNTSAVFARLIETLGMIEMRDSSLAKKLALLTLDAPADMVERIIAIGRELNGAGFDMAMEDLLTAQLRERAPNLVFLKRT